MAPMNDVAQLQIGITLPILSEIETQGIPDVRAMARHVEELGFDSVRIPDLITGDGTPSLEATVTAATVAAVTERVRISFGVRVLPLQPVAWLAAQVATLQHLSGNRVVLGVGSGGFHGAPFWRAVGVPAHERGRRTVAALEVLPRLIAGEETRLEHEPDRPIVRLAPGAPVPPILIGGNSNVAIRRTVTYGDGWTPSSLTPEALASGAQKLRELAAECRRAIPSITVAGGAVPGNDDAARSAREAFVRRLVEGYGLSAEEAARIPVSGSPAEMAERFAAYSEAGAEGIGVGVFAEDWLHAVELIAEARALLN